MSTELNYEIITRTKESITKQAVKETNLKIYPKGTFVIAIIGLEAEKTRGRCAILGIDATISQSCAAFSQSKKFDTNFLYYYFLQFGEKMILTLAQGTKQQNFYPYLIGEAKIAIPTISEQNKITSILSNVDSQIKNHQEYKSNLETLKKGLMQKLLSGQISVMKN